MRRDLTLGVAVSFVVLWALLTHTHINSWNEFSRLAAVEALVDHGTWVIDSTALGNHTGDRVLLNGHFYSDKPPVFTFAAAGVYAVLHRGLGLEFDPQECDPHAVTCTCFAFQCPRPFDWAFYLMTLIVVGVPSALMLALFYRSTALYDLANLPALILTGLLGLGTLILPYSLVFTNHVPAAACLLAGLCALIRARSASAAHRWLFAAGLFTALAFALEFQIGLFLIVFLIVAVWRHRRSAWPFLMGALVPLALTAALDWWMLGDLLPPQLHAAGYNYPGSALYGTAGGTHGASNLLDYAFRILVGDHGVFAFTPVMLWIVFAAGTAIRQRGFFLRGEAIAVGSASLIVTLYIILFTDNFGGQAYGPRWFIAVVPPLFVFAAAPFLYRSRTSQFIFAVLSGLSLVAAWQGASNPWQPALPPLRFETSAAALLWPTPLTQAQVAAIPYRLDVTFQGSDARLMGYALNAEVARPGEPLTVTLYWEALEPTDHQYAAFVHLINSAGALSSQRDSFPGLGNIPTSHWKPGDVYADVHRLDIGETVYAPDDALVRVGLYRCAASCGQDGPRLAAFDANGRSLGDAVSLSSVKITPRPGDVPNPVKINFGNQVTLVGYDVSARVIRPGDELSVTLYWRALAPVQRDYSVFLHLARGEGTVVRMNDGLPNTSPKRMSRWSPGQVMREVRSLNLLADTPAGLYNVELGIFSDDEGRLPIIAPDGHYLGEQLDLVQVRVTDK